MSKRFLILLCWLIASAASGCTTWHSVELDAGAPPQRLRLTTDAERIELTEARIVGDSVSGLWRGAPRAVARRDVQEAERGEFSATGVALLVAGALLVLPVVGCGLTDCMGGT